MGNRRPVTLWLTPADFGIWLGYIAMLCAFVPFHEPWADEAQAWLLSRDLSLPALLFRNLRYEGHPALWYVLLWIPTHLHVSYALFNWFSAAIASAGIYVLLRYAPFPLYLRALLPFTFFLGYQYAIVARSYVLFPLLGFLIAHVYRLPKARPVLMAVLLALLANVSVHGTLVAIVFGALYAWKLKHSTERGTPSQRDCRTAAVVFVGSILFVGICLWPAVDSLPRLSPTLNRILAHLAVPAPTDATPRDFVPTATAPAPIIAGPLVAAAPKNIGYVRGKDRLNNIPVVLGFAFASSWIVALLYDAILLAYLYRRKQLKLALPAVLLSLFLVFVYSAPWHNGLLWITGLMVLWAVWDSSVAPSAPDLQNGVALSLALLCLLQLPWTFNAFRYDLHNPTSPDKATAAYLHTVPPGSRIAGFGLSIGVQPYFRSNVFFNQHETFTYFGRDPYLLSPQQVIALHPDIIATDSQQLPIVEANGYRLTHVFCGALYFPNSPIDPSCLSILEPAAHLEPLAQ